MLIAERGPRAGESRLDLAGRRAAVARRRCCRRRTARRRAACRRRTCRCTRPPVHDGSFLQSTSSRRTAALLPSSQPSGPFLLAVTADRSRGTPSADCPCRPSPGSSGRSSSRPVHVGMAMPGSHCSLPVTDAVAAVGNARRLDQRAAVAGLDLQVDEHPSPAVGVAVVALLVALDDAVAADAPRGRRSVVPGTQVQPAPLILQSAEQPSPSAVLPSSQTSPAVTLTTPSPQRGARMHGEPGAGQHPPRLAGARGAAAVVGVACCRRRSSRPARRAGCRRRAIGPQGCAWHAGVAAVLHRAGRVAPVVVGDVAVVAHLARIDDAVAAGERARARARRRTGPVGFHLAGAVAPVARQRVPVVAGLDAPLIVDSVAAPFRDAHRPAPTAAVAGDRCPTDPLAASASAATAPCTGQDRSGRIFARSSRVGRDLVRGPDARATGERDEHQSQRPETRVSERPSATSESFRPGPE